MGIYAFLHGFVHIGGSGLFSPEGAGLAAASGGPTAFRAWQLPLMFVRRLCADDLRSPRCWRCLRVKRRRCNERESLGFRGVFAQFGWGGWDLAIGSSSVKLRKKSFEKLKKQTILLLTIFIFICIIEIGAILFADPERLAYSSWEPIPL